MFCFTTAKRQCGVAKVTVSDGTGISVRVRSSVRVRAVVRAKVGVRVRFRVRFRIVVRNGDLGLGLG